MNRRSILQALAALPAGPVRSLGFMQSSQLGANTAIKGLGLLDALALLRRLAFPIVEIHAMGNPNATPDQFPGFQFDRLTAPQKQAIKAALRGFRHVTAHLPYTGLDYFAKDESVAEASSRDVDIAIEGAAFFGARLAVLHPKPGSGQTVETQWPAMLRRFRRWGDLARRHRLVLALETGFPPSIAGYVRLIREIDHPAVAAAIDVGHQSKYAELAARVAPQDRATPAGIRAYNDTTLAIVEALGAKVCHLHIHDIDPQTWQEHRPLGTNFVDFPRLFALLQKLGYHGHLIFEIAGQPEDMERHLRDGKARLEKLLA